MIVVIEGIDASGKDTQVEAVLERLHALGVTAVSFTFPHYTGLVGGVIGRVLRGETMIVNHDDLLEANDDGALDLDRLRAAWSADKAYLIQAAMTIDRAEHMAILRDHEHSRKSVLVLGRYSTSALVYGQCDGLPREWLVGVNDFLPKASAEFLLDISVEESVRRRPVRRDGYEKATDKLTRVRDLYLHEFGLRKHHHVIDGTLPPDTITETICDRIVPRLDETVRLRIERPT